MVHRQQRVKQTKKTLWSTKRLRLLSYTPRGHRILSVQHRLDSKVELVQIFGAKELKELLCVLVDVSVVNGGPFVGEREGATTDELVV